MDYYNILENEMRDFLCGRILFLSVWHVCPSSEKSKESGLYVGTTPRRVGAGITPNAILAEPIKISFTHNLVDAYSKIHVHLKKRAYLAQKLQHNLQSGKLNGKIPSTYTNNKNI